ncbi:MAG: VWA domain-containing protein [Bacteroidetes bacterium]|nr:MAG: VWA domain-containing protein [Bacteroidota bacterium]
MFRFEVSTYLWGLAALPLLVVLFFLAWRWRQKALQHFGGAKIVSRLAPGLSRYKHGVKFGLLVLALASLVLSLANPQWGGKRQPVQRKGIELFIALDVSRSMLAVDISPNRLERAKRFGQQLVERLAGNQVGVILFACNAFPVAPLTSDYYYAQLALGTATTDQAGAQGTAIGQAIDLAERLFNAENEAHKAIIIITDGEDHDGRAAERAAAAYEHGTLIYTVGVGEAEGSFIPVRLDGGREDFVRDVSGNPVRSRLNPATLEEIARAGGGAYFSLAGNAEALADAIQARIDAIEKQAYEQRMFTDYESYFQLFVGLALALLLIEFLLSYRSSRLRRSNRRTA